MNFIKILIFSKTVLLTTNPVAFVGEYEIHPEQPVTAITSGASLQIDLSDHASGISIREKGILEARKLLRELVPEGGVEAMLYGEENSVLLDDTNFSLSNDGATLILSSKEGVPVDVEFQTIRISSRIELRNIEIYWKNFKH